MRSESEARPSRSEKLLTSVPAHSEKVKAKQQLRLENKKIDGSVAEKPLELKMDSIESAREVATPFQPGDGGFRLVDDAPGGNPTRDFHTVPEYRKSLAPLKPGLVRASVTDEKQSIVQPTANDEQAWAQKLAPVQSKRKMLVFNLPKRSAMQGKGARTLIYNACADVLCEREEGAEMESKPFIMAKPVGIPPPKTLGEARKSAWWDGYTCDYRGSHKPRSARLSRASVIAIHQGV